MTKARSRDRSPGINDAPALAAADLGVAIGAGQNAPSFLCGVWRVLGMPGVGNCKNCNICNSTYGSMAARVQEDAIGFRTSSEGRLHCGSEEPFAELGSTHMQEMTSH